MIVSKNNKLVTRSDKALSSRIVDTITPSWRSNMTVGEGQVIIEFAESIEFPSSSRGLDFEVVPGTDGKRWLITYTNPEISALRKTVQDIGGGENTCYILEANLTNIDVDGLLDVEYCEKANNIVIDNCSTNYLFDNSRPGIYFYNVLFKNVGISENTFYNITPGMVFNNVIFDNCTILDNATGYAPFINCAMINTTWEDSFANQDIRDCVFIGCTLSDKNVYTIESFEGKNIFIDCDISFDIQTGVRDISHCEFTNCRLNKIFMYTHNLAPYIYTDSCVCTEIFHEDSVGDCLSLDNWQVYGSASQFHNIITPDSPDHWNYISGALGFYNRCKAAGVSDVNGSACFGTSADKPHSGDWLQIPVSWGGLL